MARVARTSGRVAAAAFAGLEDQKPVEYQFNRRMVFGPASIVCTPQNERTQLAAAGLQDICKDAMLLGASFAEDPAIQAAVLAKLQNSPDLQAVMSSYGIGQDCLEVVEIQNQAKELQTELEWQQDLNQDMITHAERLAEERAQLKARVVTLEKENENLRSALERVDSPQAGVAAAAENVVANAAAADVLASSPRNEPLRNSPPNQRARGVPRRGFAAARGGMAGRAAAVGDAEEPTGAKIVMQMALAFAAVVVALVVAKKMPAGLKASAILGAVMTAFGSFRQ